MIVAIIMWANSSPCGVLVGTFGEKFREERERRGFTLDDISSVTKINSRMLQAIEQEQFSVLPGGVFNKGFVRAYAKHLGLNPEQAIAEYLTALRQAQLAAEAAAWDQPLPPPKTIPSPAAPTPPKPPAVESKPKVVEPNSPAASLHWTNAQHSASAPLSQSASPEKSSSSDSTPEPSLPKESLDKPAFQESQLPQPLVQPPPIAPPTMAPTPIAPATIAPATTHPPSPPPLWIPPSPTAKASMIANSKPANSTPQSATSSPIASSSTQPATVPAITFPGILPKQLPPSFTPQPTPKTPLANPLPSHPVAKKTIAAPAPHPPAPAAPWKLPALILTVAAIVIAALLSTRHSHSATTTVTAPVQMNPSSIAQPVATTASPAPSNAVKTATPPTHLASSQLSTDSATQPSPVAATPSSTTTHAASPKAPTQFRLSLRASENCSISITADGELVTRENLIAPANATVKATHEIVVEVSNAAAVTFRLNDRQIPTQGAAAEAQAKTFIFDSTGLRTPEQNPTNPIR